MARGVDFCAKANIMVHKLVNRALKLYCFKKSDFINSKRSVTTKSLELNKIESCWVRVKKVMITYLFQEEEETEAMLQEDSDEEESGDE